MENQIYFGLWSSYGGMRASWREDDGFPPEADILFASYDGGTWDGDALVVFRDTDGSLSESNGAHCSCYGLEGQWSPESTSWGALAMRKLSGHDKGAQNALKSLAAAEMSK